MFVKKSLTKMENLFLHCTMFPRWWRRESCGKIMFGYLVAVRLNNRSFITAEPVMDSKKEAHQLALQYSNDPLWQGVEIVTLWNRIEVGSRIKIERKEDEALAG